MDSNPRVRRILIVRFSVKYAKEEVKDGGCIVPKPGGGAWVYNRKNECLGYLTKQDCARFNSVDSGKVHLG